MLKTKCPALTVPVSPDCGVKFLFNSSHSGPITLSIVGCTADISFREGLPSAQQHVICWLQFLGLLSPNWDPWIQLFSGYPSWYCASEHVWDSVFRQVGSSFFGGRWHSRCNCECRWLRCLGPSFKYWCLNFTQLGFRQDLDDLLMFYRLFMSKK